MRNYSRSKATRGKTAYRTPSYFRVRKSQAAVRLKPSVLSKRHK